jgi:hypothetical protein
MSCAHPQGTCIECEIPIFTRNHYFTGKLMVERDFTDEQRFLVGKDRRHVQRLHGWGTVCGLKVVQHPQDACRDRWVIIEPGTGIDCCGREIVVRENQYFDFLTAVEDTWVAVHGAGSQMDNQPHTLQICLSYRECGTEEVPVLFDDNGCDDSRCQPNRILESFGVGVRIDPPPGAADPDDVSLNWQTTLNVARAGWVYRHEATDRVYVLAQPDTGAPTLYGFSADHLALVDSHTVAIAMGETARQLAISPDGKQAYVAVASAAAGSDGHVHVLDLTAAGYPETASIDVTGVGPGTLRLAVASNGLFVLNTNSGAIGGYAFPFPPVPAATAVGTVAGAVDFALSTDGSTIYVANKSHLVNALPAGGGAATIIDLGAGYQASFLHLYSTTAGDDLAAAGLDGSSNPVVSLVGLRPGQVNPVLDLGHAALAAQPVAVTSSPGGAWLYVLEQGALEKGFVQPVSTHRMQLNQPNPALPQVPIGERPNSVQVSADGTQMYAAFFGLDTVATAGGVAVLEVAEHACDQLWQKALDACPTCVTDDCLVLATILGYVHGQKVDDAQIDNLRDRKILASTELIQEVVDCLLETGGGAKGPQGPPGPPGQGLNDVIVDSFPDPVLGSPPLYGGSFSYNATTGILHLSIPKGPKGDPGADGKPPPPAVLTRICGISWPHDTDITNQAVFNVSPTAGKTVVGLLVMFDSPITPPDKMTSVLAMRVLGRSFAPPTAPWPGSVWVDIQGEVQPVAVTGVANAGQDNNGQPANVFTSVKLGTGAVLNGLLFRPFRPDFPAGDYRVLVDGDFIEGLPANAKPAPVDGNHLEPFLSGMHVSGDGTEGGLFNSWFTVSGKQISALDAAPLAAAETAPAPATRAAVDQPAAARRTRTKQRSTRAGGQP